MMESNVKFKSVFQADNAIYGLDEDGQLWLFTASFNEWHKVVMPMDWAKELNSAIYGFLSGYMELRHKTTQDTYKIAKAIRAAHAAFMLHPELREE